MTIRTKDEWLKAGKSEKHRPKTEHRSNILSPIPQTMKGPDKPKSWKCEYEVEEGKVRMREIERAWNVKMNDMKREKER